MVLPFPSPVPASVTSTLVDMEAKEQSIVELALQFTRLQPTSSRGQARERDATEAVARASMGKVLAIKLNEWAQLCL